MKKIVFVMPSLSAGGGEKSLINLLMHIDYSQYEVDLFLFKHDGLFMELVPKEVRILQLPPHYEQFALPIWQSLHQLVKSRQLSLAYHRLMFAWTNRSGKSSRSLNEQQGWKHVGKALEQLSTHYDAAIGFLEKTATYFCVDKVQATTKIGWIHTDYDQLGTDPGFDRAYFEQLDYIVTVSEECAHILNKRFPHHSEKTKVIYNIASPALIRKLATHAARDLYKRKPHETIIVSVGRLHEHKNFALAIESCKKLLTKGYNVRWFVIGEGEQREVLTKLIHKHRLEEHFVLLGLKTNPYPYIKQADIYVQTSKIEGKSIAIDEAKILQKPIVVTNFTTATDQIKHGENGVIVQMNSDAVAAGIMTIIEDRQLQQKLMNILALEQLGTEAEIHKLYELVGESS